jgi:hypothetical protein
VALEAGGHALETFTSLQEAREQPEPLPGEKAPSRRRKTGFECMKAEREQAQPQLYGTSYLFVKIVLTGLLPIFARILELLHETHLKVLVSAW